MRILRGLAVLAVAALAVGCTGGTDDSESSSTTASRDSSTGPPEIDLDAALEKALEDPQGSFVRSVVAVDGGSERELMVVEVAYDLDTGFVDSTVKVLADAEGNELGEESGTLRFITTPERTLMRHPKAEERCGTPWVEMPHDMVAAATGVDPGLLVAEGTMPEPFAIIDTRSGPDEVLLNDGVGTLYGIEVDATSGMSAAVLLRRPEIAARLEQLTTKAVVRLRRPESIASLEVHMTEEVAEVLGAGAGAIKFVWDIRETAVGLDQTLPTNIASGTCLDD